MGASVHRNTSTSGSVERLRAAGTEVAEVSRATMYPVMRLRGAPGTLLRACGVAGIQDVVAAGLPCPRGGSAPAGLLALALTRGAPAITTSQATAANSAKENHCTA